MQGTKKEIKKKKYKWTINESFYRLMFHNY